MPDVTQDFMYELLKKLNQRFDKVDHAIGELRADNMTLPNQLHVMQGDVNNLRATIGHIGQRLDRIENRLEFRELSEAQSRFEPHP